MRYLSVCSGIEAASVAWRPLGWSAVAYSEIDPFPSAVLAHRFPSVPNWGDMTHFSEWPDATVDLLVGGTPCQSFSVAGLRAGLDDPRGNLMLVYLALAARYRPQWLVWENVPGVLSSNKGRDFGAFLGAMGKLGYGFAYRVLDAQYVGLAQRRKRVFVVGRLGDWRRAAAVLLEPEGMRGDPPPRRTPGQGVAGTLDARPGGGGGYGTSADNAAAGHLIARCITTGKGNRQDFESTTLIAHTLRGEGFDASEDGTGRGIPLVVHGTQDPNVSEIAHALGRNNGAENALCFDRQQITSAANRTRVEPGLPVSTLAARSRVHVATQAVRRLTPREAERLQGFPDDWTLIDYRGKHAADGPRYRAIGNSMAVPCMAWIGRRIHRLDRAFAEAA